MSLTESEKRYEAVLKHHVRGVLHMAHFEGLDEAHAWLRARWKELGDGVTSVTEINLDWGGAIYDNHENHKRVLTIGAAYLV